MCPRADGLRLCGRGWRVNPGRVNPGRVHNRVAYLLRDAVDHGVPAAVLRPLARGDVFRGALREARAQLEKRIVHPDAAAFDPRAVKAREDLLPWTVI